MIEGRNIICIASNWFYDPTSKHHIMRILSERNHIVWVNYHASRRPRATVADAGAIAGKLREFAGGPRRVSDSLTVLTPIVLPWPGNRTAARANQTLVTRQIRRVLRTLPNRPVQLWSFAPDVDYLCGAFDEECVVYYCVDEFGEFAGYDRDAILRSERRLCEKADLVVVTSEALQKSKTQYCRRAAWVPHGVDFHHFHAAIRPSAVVPDDIASLRRPRIGFWGLMQEWFDEDLVAAVAQRRPDWEIVLLGEARCDVKALRSLPNVHLLGRKPYSELPAYAAGLDVGLIPFRVNDLTRAVNPIKLREYLSAGLPVVSTPLPEVAAHGRRVEIAEGPEDFVRACERSLQRRDPTDVDERVTAMSRESWRSRVETLSDLVAQVVGRSPGNRPRMLQPAQDPI